MRSQAISLLLAVSRLCLASKDQAALLLESKTELFLSAPSFAVVGASDDETKFGTIVFKTMLEHGLDVVPVNPFLPASQSIPTVNSLADLVDPAHTAVSIVTQPSVSLKIVRQAEELGIFAVWLQPGAEDAAVLDFIANTSRSGTTYIHSTVSHPDDLRRRTLPACGSSVDNPDLITAVVQGSRT